MSNKAFGDRLDEAARLAGGVNGRAGTVAVLHPAPPTAQHAQQPRRGAA